MANPLPVLSSGNLYRIFYIGRDEHKRSSVGAFDYDIERKIVVVDHQEPFFCAGPKSSFYEDGVSICNCYQAVGVTYMLFMGWQNLPNAHWRGDIGRLRVHGDLTLSLDQDKPFITAEEFNSISLSCPWVQRVEGGGFEM